MKKATFARAVAAGALTATAALALAACSTTPTPMNDSGANQADVMFVQMMIPHHEQAIEMSDMLLAKAGVDADIIDMAEEIKAAQAPEIAQMESWLDGWGLPSMGGGTGNDGGHGMDHGGSDGMMSEDDMQELQSASGSEAGDLFLEQMIVHHEGAIEMADTVIDDGRHPDVGALADEIVASQTDEIGRMRSMLGS